MTTYESRAQGPAPERLARTTSPIVPGHTVKDEIPRDKTRRWRREAQADPEFGFSDPARIKALYAPEADLPQGLRGGRRG